MMTNGSPCAPLRLGFLLRTLPAPPGLRAGERAAWWVAGVSSVRRGRVVVSFATRGVIPMAKGYWVVFADVTDPEGYKGYMA